MNCKSKSGKPFVVGVVGGIASGKSNFSNVLQSLGAERIDADAIAHQVLQKPLVVRQLIQLLGARIVDSRGHIDRAVLADIVFPFDGRRPPELVDLEKITHPVIHAEAVRKLSALKREGECEIVVFDAPLLLEAGWSPMCDIIVFIDTPRTVRLARASARGWSEEHFDAREAAQCTLQEKRLKASHSMSGECEVEQVREYCQQLLDSATKESC